MIDHNKLLTIALVIGFFATFLLFYQKPFYSDEPPHFSTVSSFCNFKASPPSDMPTIAGYHFFAGMFGYLTSCTESVIRLLNLLLGLGSVFVVYFLAKELDYNRKEKSLLTALLPILFPFFFLIYTDVLSVLAVLLMVFFLYRKDYLLSGLFGLISFTVRQNNIIWVIFCLLFVIMDKNLKLRIDRKIIKNIAPYIFVLLIASLLFVEIGGFAVAGRERHPSFFLGPMNVYAILFFFLLINLPEHILNFRKVFYRIKSASAGEICILAVLFLSLFILIFFTFSIDHEWNGEQFNYFLRNRILNFFDSNLILKAIFSLSAVYSIISISKIKLADRRHYLIYPLTLLFLAPSWLIEIRYYIIPIVLINLFASRERKTERILIIWYLIFTLIFMFYLYQNLVFW